MLRRPAHDLGTSFGLLLVRLALGAIFFAAAVGKFRTGVGEFVSQASGAVPSYLPPAVGKAYLYAVPFAEAAVGALLIVGLFGRITGAITSLMLLSFIIAVTGVKDDKALFNGNVTYLAIAILIAFAGSGAFSVDSLFPKFKAAAAAK